jgi:hypothetical protein
MSYTTTLAGAKIGAGSRVTFLEMDRSGEIHTVTVVAAGPVRRLPVGDLCEFATLDLDGNVSGACELRSNQLVTIHQPGETL